jgi:hypothetical protein
LNGGDRSKAAQIAGHALERTTASYERRSEEVGRSEIERVQDSKGRQAGNASFGQENTGWNMTQQATPTPRVFISYSWTNEEHTQWVADLGERLMSDGIDVVLDQWSLKDGQALNSFMEQMVTDPSIKRVIIISDSRYAAKADTRTGGVGTESQIISSPFFASQRTTAAGLFSSPRLGGCPCSQSPQEGGNRKKK